MYCNIYSMCILFLCILFCNFNVLGSEVCCIFFLELKIKVFNFVKNVRKLCRRKNFVDIDNYDGIVF